MTEIPTKHFLRFAEVYWDLIPPAGPGLDDLLWSDIFDLLRSRKNEGYIQIIAWAKSDANGPEWSLDHFLRAARTTSQGSKYRALGK